MADLEELALLEQWDLVERAIDRVVTALPSQMSVAVENLEGERFAMRRVLHARARTQGNQNG